VADADLAARAEALTRGFAVSAVVVDTDLIQKGKKRLPALKLRKLHDYFNEKLVQMNAAACLGLPRGVFLDDSDMPRDSLLAQALRLISDSLRSAPLSAIDFDKMQKAFLAAARAA
jgi:hypothetical protein